jgi:hypothetical protein
MRFLALPKLATEIKPAFRCNDHVRIHDALVIFFYVRHQKARVLETKNMTPSFAADGKREAQVVSDTS